MECIQRPYYNKLPTFSYDLQNYNYTHKDKLEILKYGHDITRENLNLIFSNEDLNYTYSDISNFILGSSKDPSNLLFNLNYENTEHQNIIKNILWNVSNYSYFYNKSIFRYDPDGNTMNYNDFVEKDTNSTFSKERWTIINIFSKEQIIKYFGEQNLIYYNSLINLQAVHVEYKRIHDNDKSLYKQIFNFKQGNTSALIYSIIDYKNLYV